MRWVLVGLTALGIIVGGWFLTEPEAPPPPSSAVAGVSIDELCRSLERAAFVEADRAIREFRRHHATQSARHDHHYTELRGIMRAKGCLAPV